LPESRLPASRSRENYLKALLQLGADEPVPVSVLARHLRISAPSVTNMLARLSRERLVVLGPRGAARLSPAGEGAALQVLRRHRLLETFLVNVLELDWRDVHEDAEELEHHVSERVLDALDRFMGHPTDDPHGHPIPDREGRLARRVLAPLAALPTGSAAEVREVRGGDDRARMARWKKTGLVPGAQVRMVQANADDGVFTLEIAGRRLVSGREGLEGIMIERRTREAR